jgi:hypothetical protein
MDGTKKFTIGEYTGPLERRLQHGRGRIIFTKGTTYDRDWHRDMAAGREVYTWPDGARYEGLRTAARSCADAAARLLAAAATASAPPPPLLRLCLLLFFLRVVGTSAAEEVDECGGDGETARRLEGRRECPHGSERKREGGRGG